MKVAAIETVLQQLNTGNSADLHLQVGERSYCRRFVPTDRLIILGGGHIAVPLCEMASMLDFSVTVVDDRPEFACVSRFERADKVICNGFSDAISELKIRRSDYVCVLTRGHRYDRECVRTILSGVMPAYLGMIGSRRRVKGLRDLLAEEGYDSEKIAQMHAPIGVMIGAVTPAEIAVSILAQIIECRRASVTDSQSDVLPQTNTDLAVPAFLSSKDAPRALLCVLDSTGSTPVKGGAIMAVSAFETAGTIGGGCGEAEAIRQARRIIGTGEKKVIEVDMTNDVAAEDGMVCGGMMRVLIEDITT